MDKAESEPRDVEWPTLAMFVLTYGLWAAGTLIWDLSAILSLVVTTWTIAQFSSLQHEVLHGHPFASKRLNEALVFPALTLCVPFERFRDLHLQHHFDPNLTDPYDDPESNFQDPEVWARLPVAARWILGVNSTLAGRILIGPAVSLWFFITGDIGRHRDGDKAVARAWAMNALGVGLVLAWLTAAASMPVWAYCIAAYLGFGLLKIRTYLEHRAHDHSRARSVIIESRGPLALLFLNNSFHAVHHMHPGVAWYRLPGLYASRRDHYLRRNGGYVYRSYVEIFAKYLFRAKDPVAHPIWPVRKGAVESDELPPLPVYDNLRKVGLEPELSKNGTPG